MNRRQYRDQQKEKKKKAKKEKRTATPTPPEELDDRRVAARAVMH